MSRYISAALAVSASIVSVVAQDPTVSQFPATPLASKHFSYPSGIVCVSFRVLEVRLVEFFSSPIKPIPTTFCVALSSVTTCAILPPRTRTPFAKPPSLTTSMVSAVYLFVLYLFYVNLTGFRFLSLGAFQAQFADC